MTRMGVILGSTRLGRRGGPVARSVMDEAGRRSEPTSSWSTSPTTRFHT